MRIAVTAALAMLVSSLACTAIPENRLQQTTAPAVEAIFPTSVAAGSSDLVLSISGRNFSGQPKVFWNDEKLFSYASDQQIYAVVRKKHLSLPRTVAVVVEGESGVKSDPVTITITPSGSTAGSLSLATQSLPPARLGNSYRQVLTASGGVPPYTWSMPAGSLPSGLVLSATTGQLSGAPTATGQHTFTAQVTDSVGHTARKQLSLTVQGNTPAVVTSSVPTASVQSGYKAALKATGGAAPYKWLLTGGTLPQGLSLSSNGEIAGTASQEGTYSFTVEVQDALGQSSSRSLSLAVGSAASALFQEDFNSGNKDTIYSHGVYVGDFCMDNTMDVEGAGYAVRAWDYCAYKGGQGIWQTLSAPVRELWTRHYIKVNSTWQSPVCSGGEALPCTTGYRAPHWFRFYNREGCGRWQVVTEESNTGGIYLMLNTCTGTGNNVYQSAGVAWNWNQARDRYVCVEEHIRMESSLQANDGLVEIWYDGAASPNGRLTNVNFDDTDVNGATTVQQINWLSNIGGAFGNWNGNNKAWIDKLAYSTTGRIGCN